MQQGLSLWVNAKGFRLCVCMYDYMSPCNVYIRAWLYECVYIVYRVNWTSDIYNYIYCRGLGTQCPYTTFECVYIVYRVNWTSDKYNYTHCKSVGIQCPYTMYECVYVCMTIRVHAMYTSVGDCMNVCS